MPLHENHSVLLFDGVCNLCNNAVKFIIRHDKKNQFLFASIQSDAAKKLLLHHNYKNNNLDSLLLLEQGKMFDKSQAVLVICRHLGFPWKLFLPLGFLPGSWLDSLYDFVARNRYRWFGKKKDCTLELPEHKNRFIQ